MGVVLGAGPLTWPVRERFSGRYGVVCLCGINGYGEKIDNVQFDEALARQMVGKRGTLVAVVKAVRESTHFGDLLRRIFPTTPEMGERIILGTGTFFIEEQIRMFHGTIGIGLRPDDDRPNDWLDPHALHRCHEQTVELIFEEDTSS